MASSSITSWQLEGGKSGNSDQLFFLGFQSHYMVTRAVKLRDFANWKKSYDKPRQCVKKQRHHFASKGLYSQSYSFSSSYVWM